MKYSIILNPHVTAKQIISFISTDKVDIAKHKFKIYLTTDDKEMAREILKVNTK